MTSPRLYNDLVSMWKFVSPPENYVEEAATFRTRFHRHGVPDGARVLHLGSGGGSIDFNLKQFYRVTGVDISEAMLGHARTVNPEVEYLHGDIRSVRLGRTFDAVLLHDAIAYLTSVEDLERAYRTAAAHLEPGGVMVTLPEELRTRFVQNRATADTTSDGTRSVTVTIVTHDPDPSDHSFETTFVYLIRDGASLTVELDTHINGIFELEEFLGAMRRAGFKPTVDRWELSDWDGEPELPLVTAVLEG